MTPAIDHPSIRDLVSLLAGEAPGAQSDELFEHVAECSRCQARCERIWAEASPFHDTVPSEIDEATAREVEHRFLTRLHRRDLTESVLGFGSRAFVFVVLGLLQPIAHAISALAPPQPERRR